MLQVLSVCAFNYAQPRTIFESSKHWKITETHSQSSFLLTAVYGVLYHSNLAQGCGILQQAFLKGAGFSLSQWLHLHHEGLPTPERNLETLKLLSAMKRLHSWRPWERQGPWGQRTPWELSRPWQAKVPYSKFVGFVKRPKIPREADELHVFTVLDLHNLVGICIERDPSIMTAYAACPFGVARYGHISTPADCDGNLQRPCYPSFLRHGSQDKTQIG